ncbi:MAG: ASKHA domain-containing protein [Candidatus Latescibacterota bacterium]|jgi:uncharacterized 2Fe-2S/4Fe-4S cluster protein (DUF4445 family)
MAKIDPEDFQKRLDRLSEILGGIAQHADEQALSRCPYKNRFDECTAQFGCRNQRKPAEQGGLLVCAGDDQLDYRPAWESDKRPAPQNAVTGSGQISCEGHTFSSATKRTLFDYADELSVAVPTSCGRTGHCHECIVEIKRGAEALNKLDPSESFLRENYRLACQAEVIDADVDIEFSPLNRTPKILTVTQNPPGELAPLVSVRDGQVYYGDECIDDYRGHVYGIAVDLGTTTVALELVDLETGQSLHVSSFENPQRFGGSDIMNRISYDGQHPNELRQSIVKALNREIMQLCERYDFARQCIYEIVIAGNSTMRDIIFRLDVQGIGQKPYKSLIELEYLDGKRPHSALTEKTRRLGLRANPKARAYGLPLIASHVGADTVAALCATSLDAKSDAVLLVDVGTNTEVVAIYNGRIVAASSPAGPAFEGGTVTYGMPGYEGAIESMSWNGSAWEYHTIGEKEPQGICGSGLIDLLAELSRHELMSPKGVFVDKQTELLIAPETGISFSRLDASNLAQAKAANYCGQYIVLRALGLNPEHVKKLYLAGGFANYVDVQAAIDIGFLAPVLIERIEKVGNAALEGARDILLSINKRQQYEAMVAQIEHIELETTPDFFDLFVDGCQFKPMPTTLI